MKKKPTKKTKTPPFTLGAVGHFGLAVKKPKKSAKWFERAFGLTKQFEFEDGIAIGNIFSTSRPCAKP